jgi:hypothetical protein
MTVLFLSFPIPMLLKSFESNMLLKMACLHDGLSYGTMLDDAATVGVMISCITPHAIASWYLV